MPFGLLGFTRGWYYGETGYLAAPWFGRGLLAWLVCPGGCLVFSAFGAGVGVVALEGTWV